MPPEREVVFVKHETKRDAIVYAVLKLRHGPLVTKHGAILGSSDTEYIASNEVQLSEIAQRNWNSESVIDVGRERGILKGAQVKSE